MNRRRALLDLFCGPGGAARGYADAGWTVTGVDSAPQPSYPFTFVQADALDVLDDPAWLAEFDAVHASPTCQHHARVTAWRGTREAHPNTLTPVLRRLRRLSVPWIVENVPEAAPAMTGAGCMMMLCGTQFGLPVKRHRIFAANWPMRRALAGCACASGSVLPFMHKGERAYADAMGCTWMTKLEARQAIPPAYTRFLGTQLRRAAQSRR